tara:strand:+ start:1314 stop:2087 length:774 start_codon:yes stop_codon:yes gene_type:complete
MKKNNLSSLYIMDSLQTPRPMPDDVEEWSEEIEELLSEWGEISMCYSYLHNYSTRKYRKKYHHLQIPIIILSTLTGTANFATDSYVPVEYQHGFSAGVGTLNIACGILGTLLAFLKYAEIYEGHRISALAWSKLSRMIEIELSLQEKKRKPCRDFLKVCRAEYDNLLESAPNIDLDIINFFNKKFEGKYPGVRRPLICNGLKAITPYRLSDNTDKIKDKLEVIVEDDNDGVEPEIQAEPQAVALQGEPEPQIIPELF